MSTLIGFDGNVSSGTATYYNPAFVAAIKDINPQVYRTPGSAACAIDPVTQEGFKWRIDKPTLDEVKLMYDVVKPRMIYVMNMLTKTPENQLKMLQYAADLGIFKDGDCIEAGNEFNIKDSAGNLKYPGGMDYSKEVKRWRDIIEPDFPNAKWLCVGENKGGNHDPRHTWNIDVLELNPDAGLVWHWHCGQQYCFDGMPNLEIIKDDIEETKQIAFPGIPVDKIYVTEFNVGQGLQKDRSDPKFANDAMQELAITTMLQKFKDLGFPFVCYHNITGSEGYGALYSDRFQTFLKPAGSAIKKFIATV